VGQLKKYNVVYCHTIPLVAAAYISRRWSGEPLWALVVGPPGTGKTLPMKLFSECKDVKMVSSLTPASLISGWGGELIDRSLMAELDGKLLIAKDFGTLLSMSWATSNEVFSILREAFDGFVSKNFGMMRREYKLKFNFVAATTEGAEVFQAFRAQLGERFIRYAHISPTLPHPPPMVKDEVVGIVSNWADSLPSNPEPDISTREVVACCDIAVIAALLRTEVIHDGRSEEVLEVPGFEGPARLTFQLTKLYKALKTVTGEDKFAYSLMRTAGVSVIKTRRARIIRAIMKEEGLETGMISEKLRLGYGVTRRVLNDLHVLGLVHREQKGFPKTYQWSVAKDYRERFKVFFG
jgi:hypothetical protein